MTNKIISIVKNAAPGWTIITSISYDETVSPEFDTPQVHNVALRDDSQDQHFVLVKNEQTSDARAYVPVRQA